MRASSSFSPLISVDSRAGSPLHKQIYMAYRSLILAGTLRAGDKIASTRELAVQLGISRIPVLNAYAQLTAEGYFSSRTGSGTFISDSLPDQLTDYAPANHVSATPSATTQPPLHKELVTAPWSRGAGAFAQGEIAFDHFPLRTWSTLVARQARAATAKSLHYSDPMGLKHFRQAIADYLRTVRGAHCDEQQIMVVSGSQQAIDICARVLFHPGDKVWVENPGYELMRQALALAGCSFVPVPVDDEGLDVAAGIKLCRRARAAFVTPSHQYPLGVTMSAPRRLQLLDWAQTCGAWIIEDDYDSEYRYQHRPIACLQGLDRNGRVIYIGTFSKTLFPALRLGYIVIPPALVDRFAALRRAVDICPPTFHQTVMTDFITLGHLSRHIRRTRILYGERRAALLSALESEFGTFFETLAGEAGMYLTIALPKGFSDQSIAAQAASQKLWLWPLSPCYVQKPLRQGFVLGFGGTPTKEIRPAVRRIRAALK